VFFLYLRKVAALNFVQELWILNTLDIPVIKFQLRQTVDGVSSKESHTVTDNSVSRNSIYGLLDKRDKPCKLYHRKYAFTIHMLQSCEMSTPESKHVCSKHIEAIAACADAPPIVLSVSRGRGERETQDSMKKETVCDLTCSWRGTACDCVLAK